jgi:hypothetical protein
MGEHFAHAHNREQLNQAIDATPVVLSSPPRIADSLNQPRDKLFEKSKQEHEAAETAWRAQSRWRVAWLVTVSVSGCAFIAGFGWPLAKATFLGQDIVP